MSNVRFLYGFKFDTGTISSSSEVAGLPDDNAVNEFVAKKWRTTGDTGQWIKFDLETAKKVTMLAIFGHNLSSAAVVTIEGNDTDVWTTPAYSQVLTWNALCLVEFFDKTYRWWRITIEDGSNTDGYIEIGRICAGEYYEPTVNIAENLGIIITDPSTVEEADGGQGWSVEKLKFRTYTVKFMDISRAQQAEIRTMFNAVGNTRTLVFALDPVNYPEEDTIYCKMKSSLSHALGMLGYGNVSLNFEEKVG